MIKNAMKTEAEKQLIKFRDQLHNLLIKYPEIRLTGDMNGDVLAILPDGSEAWPHLYVPTSGKQELISK
jgi:hypothetical protein